LKQPSWELGLICYEIVFGKYPFPNYTNQKPQHYAVGNVEFPPSILERPCPKNFKDTVQALLQNEPTSRIELKSAVKMLKSVLQYLKEENFEDVLKV